MPVKTAIMMASNRKSTIQKLVAQFIKRIIFEQSPTLRRNSIPEIVSLNRLF